MANVQWFSIRDNPPPQASSPRKIGVAVMGEYCTTATLDRGQIKNVDFRFEDEDQKKWPAPTHWADLYGRDTDDWDELCYLALDPAATQENENE